MSDPVTGTSDQPTPSVNPAPSPVIPAAIQIAMDAKEVVKNRHEAGEVRQAVINALADQEIKDRTALLTKGLEARKTADSEVKKLSKPDQEQYDANGKVVSATFSRDAAKKLREAKEKLDRIDKAIGQAINEANYDGLKKVTSGGGGGDNKPAETPAEPA